MYLIPLILSCMAVGMKSAWLVIGAVICIFVVAALAPAARYQQSLCVFVMTGIGLVPVNIWAVWALVRDFDGAFLLALMYGVLVYCIMFNIEQLVFGWLARCIWKRQKRPEFLRINA